MSRIATKPVVVPPNVKVEFVDNQIFVVGAKVKLATQAHREVDVQREGGSLLFKPKVKGKRADAVAGTLRVIVSNMVHGVSHGFEKKLKLVGVGYRASLAGKDLALTLGFSHPVTYAAPAGITFEIPSQTEIVVKGADRQLVGQVAAEIRRFRPPEPYKGKGVRYAEETVKIKETKKK